MTEYGLVPVAVATMGYKHAAPCPMPGYWCR